MPASVAPPTGSASCPRGITTHPLEIIPLFRRFRRGIVRDIIYSVIWNSLFAVFFFAIGTIFDSRAPLWPLFRNNMIFAQCIGFSVGAQVRLIPVEEVCYFQSNDKYTSVFTADGEALIRTPLRELVESLDPNRFWQVHRGTIVNVSHVAAMHRDLAGRVSLALKTRAESVAVSRAFSHRFKQM